MDTDTDTAQGLGEAVSETAKDATEGLAAATAAAAEASGTIQRDLQTLRDDFARLADDISGILSNTGNAALQRARGRVDDAHVRGQEAVMDAVGAMREVSDNLLEAVDQSLLNRPYATLAIAAGIGFLLGAAWRR